MLFSSLKGFSFNFFPHHCNYSFQIKINFLKTILRSDLQSIFSLTLNFFFPNRIPDNWRLRRNPTSGSIGRRTLEVSFLGSGKWWHWHVEIFGNQGLWIGRCQILLGKVGQHRIFGLIGKYSNAGEKCFVNITTGCILPLPPHIITSNS